MSGERPNVFELADARERMTPQPSGPPSIEFGMDDDRIIFRDQEALDEYVRGAQAEHGERIAQAIETDPSVRLGHNVSVVCSCLRCEVAHAAARIARTTPAASPEEER